MNYRLMAQFQVEQADRRSAMQILSRLATAASLLPDCSGCTLVQSADSSSPLILVEEWDSEEGLKHHVSSEGFHAILVQFGIGLCESVQDSPGDKIALRLTRTETAMNLKDYTRLLSHPNSASDNDD